MAFFDQIKDMAKTAAIKSEEFAKNVGKKAEAAMEMQKLASEMEKKERFINDNYMQMGMEIYKKASEGEAAPEYLLEYCKLIDTTMLEIDELQNKIDLIKQEQFGASPAKVLCPHCGEEVPASSKFCPECGGALKQENAAATEADQAKEQEEAVTDTDKSAETTEKAEPCSEPDAAANAEDERPEACLVAEAQPEQVNNIVVSAIGSEAEGATQKAEQNIAENDEAVADAEPILKEAEVVEQVQAMKPTDVNAEITDAEIVEPKAGQAAVDKTEDNKNK